MGIDEVTIQHFSHDHHYLKIHHANGDHENQFCQACILRITVSDRFYSCVQCIFVLHETCACLPRKIHHPLTLFHLLCSHLNKLQSHYYDLSFFVCKGCSRECCGYMYKCCEKGCEFQIDARCASLTYPIIHDCHPHDHSLFITLTKGECMACKSSTCSSMYLARMYRMPALFNLGLKYATLHTVAHYKHDKHPLTLCCGEEKTPDPQYWCEICETKLDATKWFYTCNSCSVTPHVTCLLGDRVYMKR